MGNWIAGKFGNWREDGSGREVTTSCGHNHRSRAAAEKCADKQGNPGTGWEVIPTECQADGWRGGER
jgi:hypothetical protein